MIDKSETGISKKGEAAMEAKPGSLMARLKQVPDPRRREGKRYPLPGLLEMLTLAAIHGKGGLRGMWV